MNFKDTLLVKMYGDMYFEFYCIDCMLMAFSDGLPRTNLPTAPGELVWTDNRVFKYLSENKYLAVFDNGYIITALGKMHLSRGGCRGEFMQHKLKSLSFILSLFSTVLSIFAIVIALFK